MKWTKIRRLIPEKDRALIWEAISVYIITLRKMKAEGKDEGMPTNLIDELNTLRRNIADEKMLKDGIDKR